MTLTEARTEVMLLSLLDACNEREASCCSGHSGSSQGHCGSACCDKPLAHWRRQGTYAELLRPDGRDSHGMCTEQVSESCMGT